MAAEKLQVYRCEKCGNIVQVMHGGQGVLVCCGEPMILLAENTTDAAREKHVPVVQQTADGIEVTVGSAAHPMESGHYIEWIEATVDGKAYLQFLQPGEAPEAVFPITGGTVQVRAYCNLHGLWKN